MTKIVLFTNDLMFQSRIGSIVKASGRELVVARDAESMKSRLATAESPCMVVFDLTFRGLDLPNAVAQIQSEFPQAKLIAYGPHVDVSGLEGAREAGIDHVFTRGQFERDMATILSG
jgi:DNA-binding NarL/FixJ family response regulator